tara:strand:- start:4573 stop:5136 length:564 start_codon:yes stop_codon:yes gene_type:complete
MRLNKIYYFILILCSFLNAEIGLTLVGGFNHSNVVHQNKQMQEWSGDVKSLSFAIERKLGPVKTSIGYINGGFINGRSDIDTTLNVSFLNIESYYPINIGKIMLLGGVYIAGPLSANETYSTGSSITIKSEELNIDYGVLMGGSFGLNEKIGIRIIIHYGLVDLWKDPLQRGSLSTIFSGVNIYYNL